MSEPKPNWDNLYDGGTIGLPGSDIQISDNVARWTNPSTDKWVMNSEPLSTKQLHELIVSQSMTIDRLLGEVGRYRSVLIDVVELLSKSRRFSALYKAKSALK